nr:response regulator transcription factor [Oscillibacter sp.]
MRQAHILMVEDEQKVGSFNQKYLDGQGYGVTAAETLSQARLLLEEHTPNLVLLEVMLPDRLGFDFCAELPRKTNAHIIFLTSGDENESVVKGLMQGGNDYIAKPYDLTVLSARIATQLRRKELECAGRIEFPPLSIDVLSGIVTLESHQIFLPPKELQLLCCLALSAGRRVCGEELYRRTWGAGESDWKSLVSVNISRLRKHLGLDDGSVSDDVLCRVPKRVGNQIYQHLRNAPCVGVHLRQIKSHINLQPISALVQDGEVGFHRPIDQLVHMTRPLFKNHAPFLNAGHVQHLPHHEGKTVGLRGNDAGFVLRGGGSGPGSCAWPETAVSGVFSSWDTLERNSVFKRFRFSRAAFSASSFCSTFLPLPISGRS